MGGPARDDKGAVTAELALVLPLLVAVTVGLVWLLAVGAESGEPVGIMFHHSIMGHSERAAAGELMRLLSDHPGANVRPMLELATSPVTHDQVGGVKS